MSTFAQTLLLTFLVVAFALAALGISWLLKGRCSIQPGSCGRLPGKKGNKGECDKGACSLCENEEAKKKDE